MTFEDLRAAGTVAPMPPITSGTIIRRSTSRGTAYSLRFPYKGEKPVVPLGGSWEGWTEERAEAERQHVARLIQRGEWIPPVKGPARGQSGDSFETFSTVWLAAREKRIASPRSRDDLRWRLRVANGIIGDWPIAHITEAHIDDMVTALLTERANIEHAARAGSPVMTTYVDGRNGQTYARRARGLSNGSINKVLGAVRQVLADAKRRKLITYVPIDDQTKVTAEKPSRSYLQAVQALELLGAAGAPARGLTWEQACAVRASKLSGVALAAEYGVSDSYIGRIRRGLAATAPTSEVDRWAILSTLLGAGVRVMELCELDVGDVDDDGRRLTIAKSKTPAGLRTIPLLPMAREAVLAQRAARPADPSASLFVTSNGTRQTPDNVRDHVLEPLVAATPSIAHCTPHSLRRTYASMLAEIGVPPRRAMYLMGHEDAKFTMSVYQQVMDVDDDALNALEDLIGCDLDTALGLLSGRERRGSRGRSADRSDIDRTRNTVNTMARRPT